ncbi:RNA polymerase sigma factor [Dictyobacter formicarum]|uniref:RNA polymerase sigma factor 70 region 4 type 2 domain-containing protein n=1 Tax=Dictyobacter formicarum TaxID=2778368 RepID=A0ABQ3V987_9CHLR|nr:sigma factor-like helix-turn-helix DNA-binding protein [Dictyobacter formicarum]GHO82544.1 hypothetical protein KSZ_05500 [Dictyobacter formicarum]
MAVVVSSYYDKKSYKLANLSTEVAEEPRKRGNSTFVLPGIDVLMKSAKREGDQHIIHRALQTLSIKHRTIVWLRYKEDLSFVEIGRRLNIPMNTVKTTYYRACARLRDTRFLSVSLLIDDAENQLNIKY